MLCFIPIQQLSIEDIELGKLYWHNPSKPISPIVYHNEIVKMKQFCLLTPFCKVKHIDLTTGRIQLEIYDQSLFEKFILLQNTLIIKMSQQYHSFFPESTVLSNIIPSPKGADSIDMILDKDDSALVANMLNISDRGKKEKPCLSLTIFTAECSEIFGIDFIKTANLSNIEALYECVMEENGHSFGKELLHWVINYIKENFSHVKYLQLNDESYIPCNKATNETLDLLSYSIALYCKTWYELNFNAIIIDKSKYDTYKKSIEIYKSPEMKAKINWDDFFLKNILYPFPHDIIIKDINTYKEIYDNSETFPIFFKKLSEYVGKENRCKFFKGWLELFISSYIDIGRKWTIQQSAE